MVAEALRAAARVGCAVEFWGLTPYELRLRLEAHGKRMEQEQRFAVANAWHMAAFNRAKKLPKFDELFKADKPRTLADELKAAFSQFPRAEE